MTSTMYETSEYLEKHPTWHAEHSPWKARRVADLIQRHDLRPRTLCEVGCGAGEILNQLSTLLASNVMLHGYEVSPAAFELCRARAKERLRFHLADLLQDSATFDVLLAIDVFEHIEDYMGFLRKLRAKAQHKIFHIPLDLSVQGLLRRSFLPERRKSVGHLHYFTEETALATLRDTGYRILEASFTTVDTQVAHPTRKGQIAKWPRTLLGKLSPSVASRVLGGFSLLVLAE